MRYKQISQDIIESRRLADCCFVRQICIMGTSLSLATIFGLEQPNEQQPRHIPVRTQCCDPHRVHKRTQEGAAPLWLADFSKPRIETQHYISLEIFPNVCGLSGRKKKRKGRVLRRTHCESLPTALSSPRLLPPAALHVNFGCSNTGRISLPPKEPCDYASPKSW